MSFVGSSSKANYSLSMDPHEDGMPAPVDSSSDDEWPAEHWRMPNPQEAVDIASPATGMPPPPAPGMPPPPAPGRPPPPRVPKPRPPTPDDTPVQRIEFAKNMQAYYAKACPPPLAHGRDGDGAPPGTPPAPGGASPCVPKPPPAIPTDIKDRMNELAHQLVEWHARAPRPSISCLPTPPLMMKDEPDDEPDDDDEPLDEVLPADDDTMVTMAWQAMAPDGKQWREVPLPTAQQLLIIANNDHVTRHVPGDEDLPVDAFGEPSAEQLQDIANNDIATAIDWRNIAAMDVDDFNSPISLMDDF